MHECGLDQTIRAPGVFGTRAPGYCLGSEPTTASSPPAGLAFPAPSPEFGAMSQDAKAPVVDEIDVLRSHEYHLLAVLLGRAPTADVLERLSGLQGDATPLGLAHIALGQLACEVDPDSLQREYFDLFIGVGRGELVPYASYYLTGFLHERPLARIRDDLARFGIEAAEGHSEPEDHIAILCEVMAGLCSGRFEAEPGSDRQMFERHLKPWAIRFFADLETAKAARFYRTVGAIGRQFMEIEAEALAMET